MRGKILFAEVLIIFYSPFLFPQFKIISEEIKENNYALILSHDSPAYLLEEKEFITIIKFEELCRETSDYEYILPQSDFFIAIPSGAKPKVKYSPVEQVPLNAVPEINPKFYLMKDNRLSSSAIQERYKLPETHPLIFKGYLWISNNFCMHFKFFPYTYDKFSKKTNLTSKFRLDLLFDKPLSKLNAQPGINFENEIILNTKFAEQVTTNKPDYVLNKNDSWIDYSKTYLKIGTAEDGIYKIIPADFANAGIDYLSINPLTFQLFLRGKEVPITVIGEEDSIFNAADYIEFVGRRNINSNYRGISSFDSPYNEYLDRYSDTLIYWLTWGGDLGLRIPEASSSASSPSDTVRYYDELIHIEQNPWFDFSTNDLVRRNFPEWTENETWNWWVQEVGTQQFSFTTKDLFQGETAKAFVKLQSYAGSIPVKTHNVGISLNDDPKVYDSTFFDKFSQRLLSAEFSSDVLRNGGNTLKVISFPTESPLNAIIGDWLEAEYPRQLILRGDSLYFSFSSLKQQAYAGIEIEGVKGGDHYNIYKFSDDYSIARINGFKISGGKLLFNDTLSNGVKYFLSKENNARSPKIYSSKKFINLRSVEDQADYVIITHPRLIPAAEKYSKFISDNYNLVTRVVNVFDIYDEFNYGFFTPEPIKDFLISTQVRWKNPPAKNVLLIGDANYDYHGNTFKYRGVPFIENLVPSFGAPPSDTWFVIWDTTGALYQSMNIGRIPASNGEELAIYLRKHLEYISRPFDKANKNYLLFSGGKGDNEQEIKTLKSVNDSIMSYVKSKPIGGKAAHFYKTVNPRSDFGPYSSDEIQSAIKQGGNFISYVGHSGVQIWDNSIVDPAQLSNTTGIKPLVTDFGCSTGRFAEPELTSFAELFINRPDGDAIAYISNSSLGFLSTSTTFPQLFYKRLLSDTSESISRIHSLAKQDYLKQYGTSNVYKVFSLCNTFFGDPILKLRIPPKANLFVSAEDVEILSRDFSDLDDSIYIKVNYYNLGRAGDDSMEVTAQRFYQGESLLLQKLVRRIPLYGDSLLLALPVKNSAGKHSINIKLKPLNNVDELNSNDNEIYFDLIVTSMQLKPLVASRLFSGRLDSVVYLNPVSMSHGFENIITEIDTGIAFNSPVEIKTRLGNYATTVKIPALINDKRYFLRTRFEADNSDSMGYVSFLNSKAEKFYLADSFSFINQILNQVKYNGKSLAIEEKKFFIQIFSAGYNDGRTALALINGVNYMTQSDAIGHHLVVLDEARLSFESYKRFDLLFGGSSAVEEYINFLNSIGENKLVLFAVSDEGSVNLTSSLKEKIKNFGSKFIDSISWRGAWAMVGKKNSLPGTVPEKYSSAWEGILSIDTAIARPGENGSLITQAIGPAGEWKHFRAEGSLVQDSKMNHYILGIKKNDDTDTLKIFMGTGAIDLSSIDAAEYTKLKILTEMESSATGFSPVLTQLALEYSGPSELGTNYRVISLSSDSVTIGKEISLTFDLFNFGESMADSFNVSVELINSKIQSEELLNLFIDSLPAGTSRRVALNYFPVKFTGTQNFRINIDPEEKITEFTKDNNVITVPFYVGPDTSSAAVTALFDGVDILDGDYVSAQPSIELKFYDYSSAGKIDTSHINISLNGKKVFLNSPEIQIQANEENPKYIINYSPALYPGNNQLMIKYRTANLSREDTVFFARSFTVSQTADILYVYNYPNPVSEKTYFTFKLAQIPDELRIKIFTIAGRLIKEFVIDKSELRHDFNIVPWDTKDEDGQLLANGVYFYKIIIRSDDGVKSVIQKLAIVR